MYMFKGNTLQVSDQLSENVRRWRENMSRFSRCNFGHPFKFYSRVVVEMRTVFWSSSLLLGIKGRRGTPPFINLTYTLRSFKSPQRVPWTRIETVQFRECPISYKIYGPPLTLICTTNLIVYQWYWVGGVRVVSLSYFRYVVFGWRS